MPRKSRISIFHTVNQRPRCWLQSRIALIDKLPPYRMLLALRGGVGWAHSIVSVEMFLFISLIVSMKMDILTS
jgi:hypothetical protein